MVAHFAPLAPLHAMTKIILKDKNEVIEQVKLIKEQQGRTRLRKGVQ